jgi:hypothetical protein
MVCDHCGAPFEGTRGRGHNNRVSCYSCTNRPEHRLEGYKNKHLKRNYGLTLFEFNKMLDEQQGKCRTCDRALDRERYKTAKGKGRSPSEPMVDHCHTNGLVRGILCLHCNTALGHIFDSPDILNNMIAYLSEHNGN